MGSTASSVPSDFVDFQTLRLPFQEVVSRLAARLFRGKSLQIAYLATEFIKKTTFYCQHCSHTPIYCSQSTTQLHKSTPAYCLRAQTGWQRSWAERHFLIAFHSLPLISEFFRPYIKGVHFPLPCGIPITSLCIVVKLKRLPG